MGSLTSPALRTIGVLHQARCGFTPAFINCLAPAFYRNVSLYIFQTLLQLDISENLALLRWALQLPWLKWAWTTRDLATNSSSSLQFWLAGCTYDFCLYDDIANVSASLIDCDQRFGPAYYLHPSACFNRSGHGI